MSRDERSPGSGCPTTEPSEIGFASGSLASNPLEALLDLFAEKVTQKLRGSIGSNWVAQAASPLGRRRHCAAVQRRLAAGVGGACIVGREHRLSPDALAEELQSVSSRKSPKKKSSSGVIADLERELRLVGRRS